MAEYNPDDLIGRTFLLSPNEKYERRRASIKLKLIEISDKLDKDQTTMVDNINFLLDVVEKPLFMIGLISSCPDQFSSCALS